MKALIYTLILFGVLVGCLFILLSLDETVPPSPSSRPEPSPVVSSSPAAHGTFSPDGLDQFSVEELLSSGRVLLDLWHTREATGLYSRAAAKDTTRLEALLKLTECYSHPLVWREDEARESWSRAADLAAGRREDSMMVAAMGDLFIQADYEAAAAKFEALIQAGRPAENIHYYLARALLYMGDLENAEKYVRRLLEVDESHGRAYTLLIHCAALAGSYDEAENLAKDLAALYSEEPFPYVLLSRIEALNGRLEAAWSFCLNALSLDPAYLPAILCQGELFVAQGNPEAARVSFEKLLLFDDPIISSIGSECIAYVDFLWGDFDEGSEMMDEAIRYAMLVGSVRRGLHYTSRFVDYLLQLGRSDRAAAVIDRWFTGFGDVPNSLGNLRLDIFNGQLENVQPVLDRSAGDKELIHWMRVLGIDADKLTALAMIRDRNFDRALEVLESVPSSPDRDEEYLYLRGYAAFEKGEAEAAAVVFKQVLDYPCGLDFPYHHNPIFYTQTLFYLGEAAVARGDQAEAVTFYNEFLRFWGDADWELSAVSRASEKLRTLVPPDSTDQ